MGQSLGEDTIEGLSRTPLEVADSADGHVAGQKWPSVGVVIATHNRPQLMRLALNSVLEQDYAGSVEVVLVFDQSEPDGDLVTEVSDLPVRMIRNHRTPGLAGARNSGILNLQTDLVAFCDDDDAWLPGKLEAQVTRLLDSPDAEFVTTSMRVDCDGRSTTRLAGRNVVTMHELTRSRMAMLHSSAFLFRRSAMLDGFGLVDETMPRSMGEDWDLLLRAARRRPIEHVDAPYVAIRWGSSSYFNAVWRDKNDAVHWLLDHHPEIRSDPVGAGLMYGKLAFGHAILGERRRAVAYAARAMRVRWREPRAVIALAVAAGVPGDWVQAKLNNRGHGI